VKLELQNVAIHQRIEVYQKAKICASQEPEEGKICCGSSRVPVLVRIAESELWATSIIEELKTEAAQFKNSEDRRF
jgi:hypothetical protein